MKRIKETYYGASQTRVSVRAKGLGIAACWQANEREEMREGEKNRSTDHRLLIKKLDIATPLLVPARNVALSHPFILFASQPRKKPFAFSLSSLRHHRPPSRYLLEGAAYLPHLIANERSLSFCWIFCAIFFFPFPRSRRRGCKNIYRDPAYGTLSFSQLPQA